MNTIKTTALLTSLTLLFVFAGGALAGESGMKTAFFLACLMNVGSYWFSDKIVLSMYRAQEVFPENEPELHGMLKDLCARANLPVPRMYIIPEETPNAFATGRNPEHAAVAVTQGILRLLSRDELMGVLAHELAHVRNRDILVSTIAATIAGAISMMANMAQWGMIFGGRGGHDREGGHPLAAIAMMILAPLAAMLIQMAVSRSREYLADETGANTVKNGTHLADALEKIEKNVNINPLKFGTTATAHLFIQNPCRNASFLSMFQTHPSTQSRVERLRKMKF